MTISPPSPPMSQLCDLVDPNVTDLDECCDECRYPLGGYGVPIDGLGVFHRECLQQCMCGDLWPWDMVSSAEVVDHCPGCAPTR